MRLLPPGAGGVRPEAAGDLATGRRPGRVVSGRSVARALPALTAGEHRSGLVALAGRPNAGKSTLVNRLVGEHVAAVSRRPQTTRRRVLGAFSAGDAQVVLVDLPGFQRPFDRLTERMQRSVDEALADVDAVLLVLDGAAGIGA